MLVWLAVDLILMLAPRHLLSLARSMRRAKETELKRLRECHWSLVNLTERLGTTGLNWILAAFVTGAGYFLW